MGFSWGIHMAHGSDQKLEQTITGGVIIIFSIKILLCDELTEWLLSEIRKGFEADKPKFRNDRPEIENKCFSTSRHIQTELNMIQMLPKLKIIYSPNQVYLALQL